MSIALRISLISEGLRINEAAIKSILFSIPNMMSAISRSVITGSAVFTPITFTFLLLPISAPLTIIQ